MESEGTFIPVIPAHQLLCHRCRHFRHEVDLAWCVLREPAFPALCERYEYAVRETLDRDGEIAESRLSE